MGKPPRVGIYWGEGRWFKEHNFSWFPGHRFQGRNWPFGETTDGRSVKLVKRITERVPLKPDRWDCRGLATAVYDAQIWKDNQVEREDVIVKIFMRIPRISGKPGKPYVDQADLESQKPPIHEDLDNGMNVCRGYEAEYDSLEWLSLQGCLSTPKFIANFESHKDNPWVYNGFLYFVVMTKLPGKTVAAIWNEHVTPSQEEQRRVREAFKKTFTEVKGLGIHHTDAASRNLLWDKTRCYMIDFESAEYSEDGRPKTWADLAPTQARNDSILRQWDLGD